MIDCQWQSHNNSMGAPEGGGRGQHNVPFYCYLTANPYCVSTSSVFFLALEGEEKSTFPKGEGFFRNQE